MELMTAEEFKKLGEAGSKPKKKRDNPEHRLQCSIVETLDKAEIMFFAVPNGGKRDRKTAEDLRKEGLRPGVSDLILLLPKRAVFVEVKVPGNYQSPKQKTFQKVVELLGFEYHVWKSQEEAKEFIKSCTNTGRNQ